MFLNLWNKVKFFEIIFIMITILGILLFLFNISFAEDFDNTKKTYEQIEAELNAYKNMHLVEAGFRTINIIFGWNNVFSAAGHMLDNIINTLDSYYLWTPIKWTIIGIVFIKIGYWIGFFYGVMEGVNSVFLSIENIPDSQLSMENKEILYNLIKDNNIHK